MILHFLHVWSFKNSNYQNIMKICKEIMLCWPIAVYRTHHWITKFILLIFWIYYFLSYVKRNTPYHTQMFLSPREGRFVWVEICILYHKGVHTVRRLDIFCTFICGHIWFMWYFHWSTLVWLIMIYQIANIKLC